VGAWPGSGTRSTRPAPACQTGGLPDESNIDHLDEMIRSAGGVDVCFGGSVCTGTSLQRAGTACTMPVADWYDSTITR